MNLTKFLTERKGTKYEKGHRRIRTTGNKVKENEGTDNEVCKREANGWAMIRILGIGMDDV